MVSQSARVEFTTNNSQQVLGSVCRPQLRHQCSSRIRKTSRSSRQQVALRHSQFMPSSRHGRFMPNSCHGQFMPRIDQRPRPSIQFILPMLFQLSDAPSAKGTNSRADDIVRRVNCASQPKSLGLSNNAISHEIGGQSYSFLEANVAGWP